jgi:NADP-dependent 3-hydroxy acid dehydrogenase YdfG
MKTILITGASSGIGKATAKYFNENGWNVIATMRNPQNETELTNSASMQLVAMDVTKMESITTGIQAGIQKFGKIDVLLNNAGYGAFGPLEAATPDQIKTQYDVNVFGVINSIKGIMPHFKQNTSGTIINITSIGGIAAVPMYSLYNSTKFAIEGLSEGLWYEYAPLGINVKLVEPGGVQTDFSGRSADKFDIKDYPEHKSLFDSMDNFFSSKERNESRSKPIEVAKVIFQAANDESKTLRYLSGKDAKRINSFRRWFGYKAQMKQIVKSFKINFK